MIILINPETGEGLIVLDYHVEIILVGTPEGLAITRQVWLEAIPFLLY